MLLKLDLILSFNAVALVVLPLLSSLRWIVIDSDVHCVVHDIGMGKWVILVIG